MDDMQLLNDVPSDKVFCVVDGKVIRNLDELLLALETMDAQSFSHHVNPQKNDFRNWVFEVVGDHELAKILRNDIPISEMRKVVNDRIISIEKSVGLFDTPKIEVSKAKAESTPRLSAWAPLNDKPLTDAEIASIRQAAKIESPSDQDLRWTMTKMFILGLLIGLLIGMLVARMVMYRV